MIPHSKTTIETSDIVAVVNRLKSGYLTSGDKCKELSSLLKQYFDCRDVLLHSSGKASLITSLLLSNIGKNDEVILPAYVCRDVYDAVTFVGAKPVIVDIDPDYCISLKGIEESIDRNTKAILVVHIYGIPAKIEKIKEIADNARVETIEDIAHGIGGQVGGKKLGSFGKMAFGSFNATKMLAAGEGGFLLINSDLNEQNRDFGAKLSDMAAALAISQFQKLDRFIAKRKDIAKRYIEAFSNSNEFVVPVREIRENVFFRFPLQLEKPFDFEKLKQDMHAKGIEIRRGVDLMLNRIDPRFKCPTADRLFERTISLPIYPTLNDDEQQKVITGIKEWVYENNKIRRTF